LLLSLNNSLSAGVKCRDEYGVFFGTVFYSSGFLLSRILIKK
jgi:hypothetical protein